MIANLSLNQRGATMCISTGPITPQEFTMSGALGAIFGIGPRIANGVDRFLHSVRQKLKREAKNVKSIIASIACHEMNQRFFFPAVMSLRGTWPSNSGGMDIFYKDRCEWEHGPSMSAAAP